MATFIVTRTEDSLAHHGIKGQKWGVRRFQNADMTLTPEGRERYGRDKEQRKIAKKVGKAANAVFGKRPSFDKEHKLLKKVKATAQFQDAVSNVKKTASEVNIARAERDKLYENFKKDKKSFDHWTLEVAKQRAKYDESRSLDEWVKHTRNDEQSIDNAYNWYTHRDPKGIAQYNKADQKYNNALKAHIDNCKSAARNILGKYADEPSGKSERASRDRGENWWVSNVSYLSGKIASFDTF